MDNNNRSQHTSVSLPEPILGDNQPDNTSAPMPPLQGASPDPVEQHGSQVALPQVAEDNDTIEQAWVNRVDQLVRQSVGDPRALSQGFAALKAQYISGRYGKEIKQADKKGKS